jgi:hypothetical protein
MQQETLRLRIQMQELEVKHEFSVMRQQEIEKREGLVKGVSRVSV